MNIKQIVTFLKAILVGVGPSLIEVMQTLGYPTGNVEKLIAASVSVIGVVLLILERTDRATVLDAKRIEGVQVRVDTSIDSIAPDSVVALANDRKISNVVPMQDGPHEDVNKEGSV